MQLPCSRSRILALICSHMHLHLPVCVLSVLCACAWTSSPEFYANLAEDLKRQATVLKHEADKLKAEKSLTVRLSITMQPTTHTLID